MLKGSTYSRSQGRRLVIQGFVAHGPVPDAARRAAMLALDEIELSLPDDPEAQKLAGKMVSELLLSGLLAKLQQ